MADGRRNNGGARPGAGRPRKDEEDRAIKLLKPLEPKWLEAMEQALTDPNDKCRGIALRLFAEYSYSKPVASTEITIGEIHKPDWIEDI